MPLWFDSKLIAALVGAIVGQLLRMLYDLATRKRKRMVIVRERSCTVLSQELAATGDRIRIMYGNEQVQSRMLTHVELIIWNAGDDTFTDIEIRLRARSSTGQDSRILGVHPRPGYMWPDRATALASSDDGSEWRVTLPHLHPLRERENADVRLEMYVDGEIEGVEADGEAADWWVDFVPRSLLVFGDRGSIRMRRRIVEFFYDIDG